jgi:putative transcriptional regulator
MNNIYQIRSALGLSQSELAAAIGGMTAGNVSHYEQGRQEVPPDVARRLIAAAAERGVVLTFDDIYSAPEQATA